jgi:hypothetical protein
MPTIRTDLRETLDWMTARRIRYEPGGVITATNVQDAIGAVSAAVIVAQTVPPSIVPKSITFAMSPYVILPTDYLLEVDTTGGAVVLQTGASALRNNKDVVVKDIAGNTPVNAISILRAGAELIDGLTSYPIDTAYGAVTLTPKLAGNGYEVSK